MYNADSSSEPRTPTSTPAVTPLLRTVLVCDLVESTALVERIGDHRASLVFQRHDQLLLETLEVCRGRLIDKADGVLALFERPVQAVDFALRYQRGLRVLGVELGLPLQARVGIHVGDVMTWENSAQAVHSGAKPLEVEGLAKPVAARLMALAMPGQILLSGMAQSLAQRAQDELGEAAGKIRWLVHGRYRFKGVPTPMIVHEVGEPGYAQFRQPPSGPKGWREIPLWRRPPVLAVELLVVAAIAAVSLWSTLKSEPALAFSERDWVVVGDLQNLTPEKLFDDSLDAAFRVGLEQSRYVNLLSDMQVREGLARMQRKDQSVDRQIGVELALREGARALILPAIAEVGGRIRVSVEVIDPNSGRTVFSETADSERVDGVLPAIDSVLEKLRANLGESLASVERSSRPLEQVTSGNLDALRSYSLAMDLIRSGEFENAQQLLSHAIELDPKFALAYARSGSLNYSVGMTSLGKQQLLKAESLSEHLSEREKLNVRAQLSRYRAPKDMIQSWRLYADLYPDDVAGSNNLALYHYMMYNDFDRAIAAFEPVIKSQHPLRNYALQARGYNLLGRNDFDAALESMLKALSLSASPHNFGLADVHTARRDYKSAAAYLDNTPKQPPYMEAGRVLRRLALLVDQGRLEQALAAATAAREEFGALRHRPGLAINIDTARIGLMYALDRRKEADGLLRSTLEELLRRHAQSSDVDVLLADQLAYLAWLAAREGEADLAHKVLQQLRSSGQLAGFPVRLQLAAAANAETAMRNRQPAAAIALLEPLLGKNELWEVRESLSRAYRLAADPREKEQLTWLLAHRGQAFAQYVEDRIGQVLRLIALHRARLELGEVLEKSGQAQAASQEARRFLAEWSEQEQPAWRKRATVLLPPSADPGKQ